MSLWPCSGPGLALHSGKVHNNASDCSCDFSPANVQTKACSLKLILNWSSHPSKLGQIVNKCWLAKRARTLKKTVCYTIGGLSGVLGGTHKIFLSKGEESVLPFPLSQAASVENCVSVMCVLIHVRGIPKQSFIGIK